jgi:hypothetical protein
MKDESVANKLFEKGTISEESRQKVVNAERNPVLSLHWELRTLLYLGVTILTSGIGILVYQNIDTIGHQVIIALIGLACAGCFWYCFQQGQPYTHTKVEQANPFFDYVLLLGCLLFLSFEGYLQYQYQVFGERYGLASLIPSTLFFFSAYRFDHVGILSMGITGLATWLGVSITPLDMLENIDLSSKRLIFTGEALGIVLSGAGWAMAHKNIKAHFFFSYLNFATHLLFLCTLSGLFMAKEGWQIGWYVWLVVLLAACYYHAKQEKSFYFLLIGIVYGYIGTTYVFFLMMENSTGDTAIWLGLWYFMASCAGIISFLVNHKKVTKFLFGES